MYLPRLVESGYRTNLTSDLMEGLDGVINNGGTLINVYSYDAKLDNLGERIRGSK